jgi:2-oxoglutarate ferredoxin oxidoreductase subunit delta
MPRTRRAAQEPGEATTSRAPVRVDLRLCKGCGICVALCPQGVLAADGPAVRVVAPESCTRCRLCELHCPDFAIDLDLEGRGAGGDVEVD